MGWVTWVLCGVIAAFSVVCFVLMFRIISLRKDFEIAARAPHLVLISGFTAYIMSGSVLLQWCLLSAGSNLPCWVVVWVSYAGFAFGNCPYFIRVVRLAVAYNQVYRAKYARFVKWTPMMRAWAAACVGIALRGWLFFGSKPAHSSSADECFYFDDIFLLTAVVVFGAVPLFFIARSLIHVFDAFRLRQEMERVIVICVSICGLIVGVQYLVLFGFVEDSPGLHLTVEVLTLTYGLVVLNFGWFVPVLAHYQHHGWIDTSAVAPVEEETSLEELEGVLALARNGGDLAQRFARFVQDNLCMESWDFILDAVNYERAASSQNSEQQFEAFLTILNQYLLPTSPDEVNIESKMSKRMASFKIREVFLALADEERIGIIQGPLDEIVRMLEQNLLNKFKSRVTLEREAKKERAATFKGDAELAALMNISQARIPVATSATSRRQKMSTINESK